MSRNLITYLIELIYIIVSLCANIFFFFIVYILNLCTFVGLPILHSKLLHNFMKFYCDTIIVMQKTKVDELLLSYWQS